MNLGEAVANIARKLGNRTDLDTAIANELRLAQTELEHAAQLPWFMLDEEQYADIEAGTERVELPIGFVREYEEGALWIENDDGTYDKVVKVHFDVLRQVESSGDDDEVPSYYSLVGSYFHLAPAPAAACRLRIICYTVEGTLTNDEDENGWLTYAPEVLLAKAGMRMSQYLAATNLYAMFQSQYVEAVKAMGVETTAREMENFEA